jgi:hypothetical protein
MMDGMKFGNVVGINDPNPDSPMTPEEELEASALTTADLQFIDECLLSQMSVQRKKVARVVLGTMQEIGERFPNMPDVFYVRRIKHLVDSGVIEAFGNLNQMRYSEIRRLK